MNAPIVSRGTFDAIVAIATAPGRGGVGVVRVSCAKEGAVQAVIQGVVGKVLKPRVATHARFLDESNAVIDDGIALFFPAPHSYTGESVVEFQGHGGQAVLARLLRRCIALGCRLAKPGEFTERAFLNEKLDLAQAEAVADLIDASSEAAAASAARTLTGEFSRRIHELVDNLIDLRMHVEACIDFPEEEIDPADRAAQQTKLQYCCALQADLALEAKRGAVLRDGLTVALIGRPNVGKSSLLNRLAGDEVAIVTPIAGTTRDTVRATIHLSGMPIHLIDTAGLRETNDPVERIGIERTWAAIQQAGAALLICEAGEMAGDAVNTQEADILNQLPKGLATARVYNKVDLLRSAATTNAVSRETTPQQTHMAFNLSALTGEGVDALRDWLLQVAGWTPGHEGQFMARERHLIALQAAADHLNTAARLDNQYELFAEELRLAQAALGAITGEFTPDDLLGEIFGRFCIGK